MKRIKIGGLAALATAMMLCPSAAHGALIASGSAILTPSEPDPTGGTVIATTTQPFVTPPGVGQFSGTLTTTVIQNDPSNPYAGIGDPNPANHGLTFVFQLSNDAVSTTSLGRLTSVDFTPFLTDVSYQPGAGLLPPTSTDRTSSPSTLGWSFTGTPVGLGKIAPGATSTPMVVQTNAPGYVGVLANIIDGSVVQALTYGPSPSPVGNIPEPSTVLLLLVGSLGLASQRSRR